MRADLVAVLEEAQTPSRLVQRRGQRMV